LDRDQFCNEILKIDDKIRFAAIYDEGEFHHKIREGIVSYLTLGETKNSLAQAVLRWVSRKKDGLKIGEPVYSMTKYGKANRITMPIGNTGLIIVTTELTVNPDEIAEKIGELRDDIYPPS